MSPPTPQQKYAQWRADYVRAWGDMFYIDYNKKGEVEQEGAITCSEGNKQCKLAPPSPAQPVFVYSQGCLD